ncbi:MAG: response regulator transcription factor [Rhizobacter sp.]|nr:response regulator transcription factor [Ferruginibacter sp.]
MPVILIAEDHLVVRMGTTLLIKDLYPDAVVVEADSFDIALKEMKTRNFDLVILDIHLPGGDNTNMIDAIKIRQKEAYILVFSSYEEEIYALRYIDSGADGFLSKKSSGEETRSAIRKVLNGEKYISSKVQYQLLQQRINAKQPRAKDHVLSNREFEVMNLLVQGVSNAEIKLRLGISASTLSTYKNQIFKKMNVNNIVELVEKHRLTKPD